MASQSLVISGINLKTNIAQDLLIVASNPFMLAIKYLKVIENFHVNGWGLTNSQWEAGNNGINAGAYLCETLEELSGLNLN